MENEQLREAIAKSEDEVKAIRVKLHGAIRKGKASELARAGLEKDVELLKAQLAAVSNRAQEAEARAEANVSHSSPEQVNETNQDLLLENEKLRQQIQELKNHSLSERSTSQPHADANGSSPPSIEGSDFRNGYEGFQRSKERELRQQVSQLKEECRAAEENAEILREALQSAAETIKEAEEAAAESRQELAVAEQEAEESRKKAEESSEEAAELRRTVAVLQGRLSIMNDLEVEIEESKRKMEAALDESDSFQKEANKAQSDCATLESEMVALREQIKALETEKEALLDQKPVDVPEDPAVLELRAELQSELDTAKQARQEAEKQMAAAQEINDKAAEALEAAESRAKLSEEAMQKLQAEDHSRKQKFALLHSTFAREKEGILAQLRASEDEASTLREGIQELEALKQQQTIKEEEAQEAKTLAESQACQLSDLTKSFQEQSKRLDGLSTEASKLRQQLQEADSSAEESRQECENLTVMLEEASQDNEALVAEMEALRGQFKDMLTELEQSKSAASLDQSQPDPNAQEGETGSRLPQAQQSGVSVRDSPSEKASGDQIEASGQQQHDSSHTAVIAELEEEIHSLKESLRIQSRSAAAATASQARVAALEKRNQELQWQITMINHDPEVGQTPAPVKTLQAPRNVPGGEPVSKAIGFVLRYRRSLIVGYLSILHILLYVLLSARSHRSHNF